MFQQWAAFADEWNLFHKVTFDGENKRIIINPGETDISVKIDIYSAWKKWVSIYDYSKFLPAIRTIGGDPVGGGLFAGDIYFLMNGWQVVVSEATNVTGTLYHDDSISPWIINPGGGIVATVSNLAYAYSTTGGTSGASAADVWAYSNRTLTTSPPTATQIRQEMDSNSTKLITIKAKTDTIVTPPTAAAIADQVRVELTPELNHLMTLTNDSLTSTQATMLLEMYNLLGLDPTIPLVVTNTARTAGTINQTIATDANHTVVTRI